MNSFSTLRVLINIGSTGSLARNGVSNSTAATQMHVCVASVASVPSIAGHPHFWEALWVSRQRGERTGCCYKAGYNSKCSSSAPVRAATTSARSDEVEAAPPGAAPPTCMRKKAVQGMWNSGRGRHS